MQLNTVVRTDSHCRHISLKTLFSNTLIDQFLQAPPIFSSLSGKRIYWAFNGFARSLKINPFLFMDDWKLYAKTLNQLDSLVQTVRIFSNDIWIKFGIEKCTGS